MRLSSLFMMLVAVNFASSKSESAQLGPFLLRKILEAKAPLLPHQDDPKYISDSGYTFETDNIHGDISLCHAVITGLANLKDMAAVLPGVSEAALFAQIDLPLFKLNGLYTSNVTISDGKALNVTLKGQGAASLTIHKFRVTVRMPWVIDITTLRMHVQSFTIDVNFTRAYINLENFTANNVPVRFPVVNLLVKPIFDSFWNKNFRNQSQIADCVNHILGNCTLVDFVFIWAGQDPGCGNFKNVTCFKFSNYGTPMANEDFACSALPTPRTTTMGTTSTTPTSTTAGASESTKSYLLFCIFLSLIHFSRKYFLH